ncbi:MAG: glycine-rich domain-containing protein, partial [Gaiellales bacterium]
MTITTNVRLVALVAALALIAALPASASTKRPRASTLGQGYYVTCDPPGHEVMFKIQDDLGPEHACIRVFTESGTWHSPKDVRSNGDIILVVGGGGGGGWGPALTFGGGGGAAGHQSCGAVVLEGDKDYAVVVGQGGEAGKNGAGDGKPGQQSTFPGIISLGGNGGGQTGAFGTPAGGGSGGTGPTIGGTSRPQGVGYSGTLVGSLNGGGGGGASYTAATDGAWSPALGQTDTSGNGGRGHTGIDAKRCISILGDYVSPLIVGGGGGFGTRSGGTATDGGGTGGQPGTAGTNGAPNPGGGGGG